MGYFGKIEEKKLAQQLRKQGYSYGEISKSVSVSRDTLSRWCRDISLNSRQKQRLINNKQLGQRKGSLIAAENKQRIRKQKIAQIISQAKTQVGKLSKRDRFIAGIALYLAEGDKTQERVNFANSDPYAIVFMADWLREFLNISNDRLRGAIWLHEELDEMSARLFWSSITSIPINQFHKTYIVRNKVESRKVRKNIHQFGVFSLRYSDSGCSRRIR